MNYKTENYKLVKELFLNYEYCKMSSPGLYDVIFKKVGENECSLCCFDKRNGDLMRDPEMTFLLDNEQCTTTGYQNDYLGLFREREDGDREHFLYDWLVIIKENYGVNND